MLEKKTMIYWGVLLSVVLVLGLLIVIAPAQSRYERTAVWNTIALPGEQPVCSDILRVSSQAPVTVLLGEMTQENPESSMSAQAQFQLESEKNVTGSLAWTVSQPEYLQVTMRAGTNPVQQGGTVALAAEQPVTVTMELAATELAATQPHEAMQLLVEVSWGGVLHATFAVDLPELVDVQNVMPQEQTQLQETTQPEESEPATEPDGEETPSVDPQSTVKIQTIRNFLQEMKLPVMITAHEQADKLELGIASQDGTLTGFPERTCYSLNQGAHDYMLYHSDKIRLDAVANQTLLLDFSRTQLQNTTLTLQLDAYQAGILLQSAQTSTTLSLEPAYQLDTQVMKEKEALQIRLAQQWTAYPVSYSMEKVTVVTTDLGDYTQYAQIDPATAGFVIAVTEDAAGDIITVTGADPQPEAGNYVLCIQWSDGDVVFGQTKIPFFVNYYTDAQSQPKPAAELHTESATETTGGAQQ